MKQRDFLSRMILDWLLVIPGLLGSVFCLITAFQLPIPPGLLWISIAAVTVFTLALGHKNRNAMAAFILLAVLAIPVFENWEELVESFRNLWGVLSSDYAKGYDFILDYVPRNATNEKVVGPALLALTVLEAFLCCLGVRVWRRTTPVALTLLIGIAPCFVLTDTPPMLLPLMAAVFSVLTQAFSQIVRRRDSDERFKGISFAALLSASILGLLLWIYPQSTYAPPITWEELAQKIQRFGQKQNNRGTFNAGLAGNPGSVDLTGLGALPNHPIPILYLMCSEGGELYLRGSSYSVFDGSQWTRGAESNWDQTALFPYLGVPNGATLAIETLDPEAVIYTTYQTTRLPEDCEVVSDSYVNNAMNTKVYTMQFLSETEPVTPNQAYGRWVRENCLALPDQTREGVLAWWETQDLHDFPVPGDPVELELFAQAVADRVAACATYSRNPAKMPKGKDFCTWFLNDATEGYCVHFSSSCVALLRALGIPARYVTGYICTANAEERTRVTNLQAHAWVEAWIGERWVRIEPTPADATEFTGVLATEPDETGAPQPQVKPTEHPIPETRPKPTRPTEEPQTPGGSPSTTPGSKVPEKKPVDLTPLWIFLGVLSLLLLTVGRRWLNLRLWDKRFQRSETNDAALLLFRRMCQLQKHHVGVVPQEGVRLANRARFSQHTLSDKELDAMRRFYVDQRSLLKKARLWKRLYCRYILGIV